MKTRQFCLGSLVLLLSLLGNGCAIDKLAINKVADLLSAEGSTVFTGDDDPQLIGDSLPFALKLYESLLESAPEHTNLLLATGKAFCLYAFAYLQTPAEMLPNEELAQREVLLARAKKLFFRGRNYIFRAINLRIPTFLADLEQKDLSRSLAAAQPADLPFIYWGGAAWMGAFTTDPFDMELLLAVPVAISMIQRVLELDPGYDSGSAHEIMISYYGALPAYMGGSEEKARFHFEQALSFSHGLKAAPYLNLATSICINKQYVEEFTELMNTVLALDLDASPENRLLNVLARQKAAWMLENIENWFLIGFDEDFEDFDADAGEPEF